MPDAGELSPPTPERFIEVDWNYEVLAKDKPAASTAGHTGADQRDRRATSEAALATLTNAIAKQDGAIANLKIVNRQQDFLEALVDVEVRDARSPLEGHRRPAQRAGRLRGQPCPPLDSYRFVILGIGSDICDIRRIEAVIAGYGERFLARVFTETERAKRDAPHGEAPAPTFASRFAAKEAAAKALGTGFRRGVFMSDLGVVNLPGGQPTVAMSGGAAARLAAITPAGMRRWSRSRSPTNTPMRSRRW